MIRRHSGVECTIATIRAPTAKDAVEIEIDTTLAGLLASCAGKDNGHSKADMVVVQVPETRKPKLQSASTKKGKKKKNGFGSHLDRGGKKRKVVECAWQAKVAFRVEKCGNRRVPARSSHEGTAEEEILV